MLAGIVWVLRYDVPWHCLPSFPVSGVTCWRRLRDWQVAGVWQKLHEMLLAELHAMIVGFFPVHAAGVPLARIVTDGRRAADADSTIVVASKGIDAVRQPSEPLL